MDDRSQMDTRQDVLDRRRIPRGSSATAELIMAAKGQLDVLNTQLGVTDRPRAPSYVEVLFLENSKVSKINDHAKTLSRSERCFFCLLILVTFIWAFGILTAVILLSSMMWFA